MKYRHSFNTWNVDISFTPSKKSTCIESSSSRRLRYGKVPFYHGIFVTPEEKIYGITRGFDIILGLDVNFNFSPFLLVIWPEHIGILIHHPSKLLQYQVSNFKYTKFSMKYCGLIIKTTP